MVAEFLSPADRTRLAGIELQISQAQAKKAAIAHKILQHDEALSRGSVDGDQNPPDSDEIALRATGIGLSR